METPNQRRREELRNKDDVYFCSLHRKQIPIQLSTHSDLILCYGLTASPLLGHANLEVLIKASSRPGYYYSPILQGEIIQKGRIIGTHDLAACASWKPLDF